MYIFLGNGKYCHTKGVIAPQINHILSTSSPYAEAALSQQSRFFCYLSVIL